MKEDHLLDSETLLAAHSTSLYDLSFLLSTTILSCGYQPAFTMVLIVNAASRPVFRKLFFGKMAINIYPPGRRGSGLAHADSDMGL